MFRIEWTGPAKNAARIVASETLGLRDFLQIAIEISTPATKARMAGRIAAHQTTEALRVETRWIGKECVSDAVPGDWIVTALGPDGNPLIGRDGAANIYVIRESRFLDLYEPSNAGDSGRAVFRPKGAVEAIRLPGGFEIMAPWGVLQQSDDGWLLANGTDVYGIHRDTFAATYEITG